MSTNLSKNKMSPDVDKNTEYQELLARFDFSTDNFIVNEALKIYSELDEQDYGLKIRLLELLKGMTR